MFFTRRIKNLKFLLLILVFASLSFLMFIGADLFNHINRQRRDSNIVHLKKELYVESNVDVNTDSLNNHVEEVRVKPTEEPIVEFMNKYSDIHQQRRKHIQRTCDLHRNEIPHMKNSPKLLVNKKHKMVYCQTPKAGTVSWCRIMLVLSGYKNYNEIMKMTAPQVSRAWKSHVPLLSSFPKTEQENIMNTYTKFMFVRQPFTRLLSAYNDKIRMNEDRTYARGFAGYRKKILYKYSKKNETSEIKFHEFIRYVLSTKHNNAHWREMYKVCYPCDIHYDVIGQFEDMKNEAKYILTLSNITDLTFPTASGRHLTHSSNEDKFKKAYSYIPDKDELYQRYKYDFMLFGYTNPL
ncbi:carbohydrate sulfotransferase 11-like [Antedon mediterranea]|uniref:carbohydrate sulfotransferase 11-like n=1 Tax=Antedon mediterranea TaxID=105859 RepID=UPI003AF7BC36